MSIDSAGVAPREGAAGVRTQQGERLMAVRTARVAQLCRDPRVSETAAGADHEGGRSIGSETHQRRELPWLEPVDFAVPERFLPSRRQAAEHIGGGSALERGQRGVLRIHGGGTGRVLQVHRVRLDLAGAPLRGDVAHRGQEVRAEAHDGTLTAPDRGEDAGEGLGDDVVGVEGCERARDGVRGGGMAQPQLAVGAGVVRADAFDEIVVRQLGHRSSGLRAL